MKIKTVTNRWILRLPPEIGAKTNNEERESSTAFVFIFVSIFFVPHAKYLFTVVAKFVISR